MGTQIRKRITRILKWIVILTLGWMVISCYKLSNIHRDSMDDFAKSLIIGGSPFLIRLPNSLYSLFGSPFVRIEITGSKQCGRIVISRGKAYNIEYIGNQLKPVQISLNNSLLDLTPYIQSFKECDIVRITTYGLFVNQCSLDIRYADAKIIDIGTPPGCTD